VPLTERSVEDPPDLPGIHIFRRGIIGLAADIGGADELERQVRITLLHELGHHFGLDEDDLEDLGYG
jgi:predicted Zn-dependent protease with MMP-like domain